LKGTQKNYRKKPVLISPVSMIFYIRKYRNGL
jgi:hypothetical protein